MHIISISHLRAFFINVFTFQMKTWSCSKITPTNISVVIWRAPTWTRVAVLQSNSFIAVSNSSFESLFYRYRCSSPQRLKLAQFFNRKFKTLFIKLTACCTSFKITLLIYADVSGGQDAKLWEAERGYTDPTAGRNAEHWTRWSAGPGLTQYTLVSILWDPTVCPCFFSFIFGNNQNFTSNGLPNSFGTPFEKSEHQQVIHLIE